MPDSDGPDIMIFAPPAPKPPTPAQLASRARRGFHARIGQHGRATHRCEHTLPLFPLVLILDADGTLADEVKHHEDAEHDRQQYVCAWLSECRHNWRTQ